MHKIGVFLYLNLYANIFALTGLGMLALSFFGFNPYLFAVQVIAALVCFYFACNIYIQWPRKKRLFAILVRRNRKAVRLDTLCPYAFTYCGRLVIRRTLIEVGEKKQYRKIIEDSPAYIDSHRPSQLTINHEAFERLREAAEKREAEKNR